MNKETKLAILKAREIKILARNKYLDCPGVLKKVRRQIANLEKN